MSQNPSNVQPAPPKKGKAAASTVRVSFLWDGELTWSETFEAPAPVVLGPGGDFPSVGADANDGHVLLQPGDNGYVFRPASDMVGALFRAGAREALPAGTAVPLGPTDYAVVTTDRVAIVAQPVAPLGPMPRRGRGPDASVIASMALSMLMVFALFVVLAVERHHAPPRSDFHFDAERIRIFLPPEMVEPPAPSSGTETDDAGLRDRDDQGGAREAGEQGRVGRRDAPDQLTTDNEGASSEVAARVRTQGLLGELTGGPSGNAIAAALNATSPSDILGGAAGATRRLGRGSGGSGLRGLGGGGGGSGAGSLFGAGMSGIGAGSGMGGGTGGAGVGAAGMAREERAVRVSGGRPSSANGSLTAAQVARGLARARSRVRYCYEAQIGRGARSGSVAVSFSIAPSGRVASARIARSSVGSAAVDGCVLRTIRGLRFPSSSGTTRATVPFRMSGG